MSEVSAARKWWDYLRWRLNGSPAPSGLPGVAEWARRVDAIPPPGAPGRLISVVALTVDSEAAVASVSAQSHGNWELLLPAGARSGRLHSDSRLVRVPESEPDRMAAAAMAAVRGDLVVVLHPGTIPTRHALGWIASAPPDADVVYGDHLISRRGRSVAVRLKPAWSPRLLRAHNYIGTMVAVSAARMQGLVRSDPTVLSDPWRTLLALERDPGRVAHLPVPLCTVPVGAEPPGSGSPRRGAVSDAPPPRVKVVIPIRDRADLLARVVAGVRAATGVEVMLVVVDNGSIDPATLEYLEELGGEPAVTVVRMDEPFNFSRLINRGSESGDPADLLLMLNNDIEMPDREWLSDLCRWMGDPGVVGVGPQLRFPDGRIQHAGMVMGMGGIAGHLGLGQREVPSDGPPDLPREVSCLTGACLLVRSADFAAVGGLDEDLPVDHQDVDLCLRLRRDRGGDLVYDPTRPLVHQQMASRDPSAAGSEDTIARMRAKWGGLLEEPDEFWNPHLSLVEPGSGLRPLPSDAVGMRLRLRARVRDYPGSSG